MGGLFDTDFMPHVMCLRAPGVIWLHVFSDAGIALAYLLIPLGLLRLLKVRRDLEFHWMYVLFVAFILSCAATHILAIVTLWIPFYRFEGAVKAVTAAVSLATAFVLLRRIRSSPSNAALPSEVLDLLGLTDRIPIPWQRPLSYAFSVFTVAIALLIRLYFMPGLGTGLAFLTFYPAVFLAATVGGFGPGILATLLAGLSADYFFMVPVHTIFIESVPNQIGMWVFLTTGTGISALSEGLQRTQARVKDLNRELKARIQERRQAEEKNALLSAIVENSGDAIVSQTPDGVITSWNGGARRLFGYLPEEAIGRHISLVIPPERREEAARILKTLVTDDVVDHLETERLHKDGHLIPVSLSVSPVRDAERKTVGFSAVLRDIGDRKRAEEQFRLVVESAPNAMVMINRVGQITLVNRLTEEWFGYSRQEMMGQTVEMLLPERFRGAHPEHRNGFFAKPLVVGPSQRAMGPGRELYARRKDGSEFAIEVGLNPIQTLQGPMVLSAIVDVTARKRVEQDIREFNRTLEIQVARRTAELQIANKELEDFAYAASHDLKAPLRVIDNCSKWIEEDLQPHLTCETRENMTLLRGRVRRMEKLLDDLLEYARIGRAATRNEETIRGDRLMHNILNLLAPGNFRVNVRSNFADIQVHPMPLQQILLNLVGNAIKHHDKPTGTIDVTVEDLGTMYAFAVRDDGPGIDPRFHRQIFQMFQTLKPRDQMEGSGMGLALVRKHVEVAGGILELQSAVGEGSTFRFTWPKQPAGKKEEMEEYAEPQRST